MDYKNIEGVYHAVRTIDEGAGKFMKYTGGLFPYTYEGDGKYSMKILGNELGATMIQIGTKEYIMEDNGMSMFLYQSTDIDGNIQLEMMSTDYILEKGTAAKSIIIFGEIIFGVICLLILLIKLISYIIRKIRKRQKNYSIEKIQILLTEFIYAITSIVLLVFMSVIPSKVIITYSFTAFSAIVAVFLALVMIVNACFMAYNIRNDRVRLN